LVGDMWIEYTGYLVCIKTNLHVTTDNLWCSKKPRISMSYA
jgi:hypothetical protein